MVRIFDFILSIGAVVSLLVATYLFTTDKNINDSFEELTGKKKSTAEGQMKIEIPEAVTSTQISSSPWKYVVIHHSSTKSGNARIFDRYHREEMKMKDGLAYHYVIGNGTKSGNGEVEVGERWFRKIPGLHCFDANMNEQSIGICLVGDFEKDKPTKAQMSALNDLLKRLQRDYHIPLENIIGHSSVDKGKTDCPGKLFPWDEMRRKLKQGQVAENTDR
ncbi:MAG: N-acetylmuramoyl-L-alanine amidase [Planctomycetes bacterium]|nr:N-acetylmuramoyl-L-alanine amidase [Planctomycetota bacterium]